LHPIIVSFQVAIIEAISGEGGNEMSPSEIIRLYIHEGLRIFCDRLVYLEEREWTNQQIDRISQEFLGATDDDIARPIYFSCWSSADQSPTQNNTTAPPAYKEIKRDDLKEIIKAKIQVFIEEELNVPLVVI
jgi:dynein heavy chain 1, cytosolic